MWRAGAEGEGVVKETFWLKKALRVLFPFYIKQKPCSIKLKEGAGDVCSSPIMIIYNSTCILISFRFCRKNRFWICRNAF